MKERVTQAMRDKFKPEFLNRIDEYVIFNSLSKRDLRGIVSLEAKSLEKRLSDRGLNITLTDSVLDHLVDVGFDPVYGARPLKRTIQKELETVAAKDILRGVFDDGDTILVDLKDDRVTVSKATDAPVVVDEIPGPLEQTFQ